MTIFTGNNAVVEITSYLVVLVSLFVIGRFAAASVTNFFKAPASTEEGEKPVDPFVNDVYYAVSYWSEKGGRPYQEDRHCELKGMGEEDSSVYAVYDGHGGTKAAQFCKENLIQNAIKDPEFVNEPRKALTTAFNKTDADFSEMAKAKSLSDGTTAIVAAIHGRRLYVANAGDSRCIVVQRGGKVRPMSVDHKPNREDEEKRIVQLGGKVIHWGRWRVQGVLAVSRAIGDIALKPYVTCEPEINEKDIGREDEYLVLASDGLWDVLKNEEVGKLVYNAANKDFINCSKFLCSEALIAGSTDNITVVVVDLRNRVVRPGTPVVGPGI